MELPTTLVIFAVVAAIGMIGVIGVNIIHQIDAAQPPTKGCRTSVAVNASQARCFHGDR